MSHTNFIKISFVSLSKYLVIIFVIKNYCHMFFEKWYLWCQSILDSIFKIIQSLNTRTTMLVTPFSVVKSAEIATKTTYSIRRFKCTYGVSTNIAAIAWNQIQESNDCKNINVTLKDFLMTLYFLKIIITKLFYVIFLE